MSDVLGAEPVLRRRYGGVVFAVTSSAPGAGEVASPLTLQPVNGKGGQFSKELTLFQILVDSYKTSVLSQQFGLTMITSNYC